MALSLQLCHPFSATLSVLSPAATTVKFHLVARLSRAEPDDAGATSMDDSAMVSSEDADFDDRLSQIRLKYRSGTGKKAEVRKSKKFTGSGSSSKKGGLFLPAIPLKEAVSCGLKVESGFTPYAERLNGRLAVLGISALLLVELASGKSLISYHTPSLLILQVYTVAATAALFFKYDKERNSVWPGNKDSGAS